METFFFMVVGIMIGLVYAVIASLFVGLIFLPIYGLIKLITFLTIRNGWTRENVDEKAFSCIVNIVVVISIIIGIYLGIPTTMIETAEWGPYENYVTHEIVNLTDNNEIEGRVRGRYVHGYIGEKTTYHYYFKRYDGGMELQKANEDNATIYFTDGEPRAEWYRRTRTFWYHNDTEYMCKIYIPEGSMTTEFEIDME